MTESLWHFIMSITALGMFIFLAPTLYACFRMYQEWRAERVRYVVRMMHTLDDDMTELCDKIREDFWKGEPVPSSLLDEGIIMDIDND